jgi:hypothetical protein
VAGTPLEAKVIAEAWRQRYNMIGPHNALANERAT